MKIGISVWAFPDGWRLEEVFRAAGEAGFDGVEVALAEEGELSLSASADDARRVREAAKAHGIALYSVASGLYWKYSLTSDDPSERSRARDIVKKQIEVASWLGCDAILVIPGSVGVDFLPGGGVVAYDDAYQRAFAAIDALKSVAEEYGVAIGLENVWNKFLLSPLEMRDFIDKINSGYVGAYFDAGNAVRDGYPEHWIKILGNRIKKVHFKDFRKSVGTIDGFVDLLSGDVNYPAVMAALRNAGYDGWVTAETGFSRDYPEQSTRSTAAAMKRIVSGI